IDAFSKAATRHLTFVLSLGTLVVVAAVSAWQWSNNLQGSTFHGLYVVDPLAHLLKISSYIAVAVTLIYGRTYAEDRNMLSNGGELYTLTLFALLGQMVMISAGNLLTVYLGVELMSFALYRDHVAAIESATKYCVLGSLASGVLLYGLSMVYGATGHLDMALVAQTIAQGDTNQMALVFGVVFIVAGLAFKLGAVPFHMWVPDVYHGAPTSVTLILGAAPKIASFAVMLRLLTEALHGLALDWQPMLLIMAVLSLAIGNLTAIVQTNFKR